MKHLALGVMVLAACGGSDTDVAGGYTVAITNGANGCNLMNFTPGQSNTGIGVTITEASGTTTADVGGLAAIYLDALTGHHVYTGESSSSGIDLEIIGTVPRNTGNCTYTYNSEIAATLDGDALAGTIVYRGAGNGNSDCAQLQDCESVQNFNGTRPPK